MAIKLLAKKEIDSLKAQEFRRTQDEGLKLARRIDALRQVLPQEEASLEKWRNDTVAKIHAEIRTQTEIKDALIDEVRILEKRKYDASIPLIGKSRELEERQAEVEAKEVAITERLRQIQDLEEEVLSSREIAAMESRRAFDERQRATALRNEAESTAQASQLVLAEAEAIRDSTLKNQRAVERSLQKREMEIAEREISLQLREENLCVREEQLLVGEKRLADQQSTLARSIARLKK